MRRRSIMKFGLVLEQFEAKQLLSAGSLTTHVVSAKDGPQALALRSADSSGPHKASGEIPTSQATPRVHHQRRKPAPAGAFGYLAFRVTNTPWQTPYKLIPPFQQVLVQSVQPVPGQVYNVLSVAVKNGTGQTFTASNGFSVRMTNQPRSFAGFPVLTGDQQWKPGQILVFYVLTKKYYPVSFVAGGFQFDLGGRSSTAIPGPAGIFLRLKYDPATFARTLNWIVAFGQGNQVGQGAQFGSAQHVDQPDHRSENPAHGFRRAFLGTESELSRAVSISASRHRPQILNQRTGLADFDFCSKLWLGCWLKNGGLKIAAFVINIPVAMSR